ncbi:DUF4115 domain-containing protein [Candidatus Fermentibacteria bacterium]|nr:DUF4115 domain-containing protein [Candidatus Fermentibacteria bacterium]
MAEHDVPARRSPGAALRQLRESKGLTLEAAAEATHVKLRFLQALEQEDTGSLLNPAYAKSFLKAYARLLDADPDLVEDYRGLLETRHSRPAAPAFPHHGPRARRRWWAGLLLVPIVVSAALCIRRTSRVEKTLTATIAMPDSAESFLDDPVFAAETLAVAPIGQPMLPPDALSALQIVAVESTWVEASSDGQIRLHELLVPGEVRIVEAAHQYRLTLGNAGGVELTLNGEHMAPPGPRGMVIRNMLIDVSRETAEP